MTNIDQHSDHKIARLYYIENMSQSAIARKLNVSVATISRSLARARENGIVNISIASPEIGFPELEARIESTFGLTECRIGTPAFPEAGSAGALVRPLEEMLPRLTEKNGTVGVSWGETLKSIGESLSPRAMGPVDIIPIVGAMGMVETGIYPNSIARLFAQRLGGTPYLVNAPALSDRAQLTQELLKDQSFAPVRDVWERIDVALVGCSGLDAASSMKRNSLFNNEELQKLRDAGAVAAINFTFLGTDGGIIRNELTERILHLPPELMKVVPRVVLLAEGVEKVTAIRAVLRGGWVNALITDEQTARQLLDQAN